MSGTDGIEGAAKRVAELVGGPTLVAASMYYFGYARTEAAADAAGLDQSVLGLSIAEYTLRGAGPVIRLGFAAVLVVGLLVAGSRWLSDVFGGTGDSTKKVWRKSAIVGGILGLSVAVFGRVVVLELNTTSRSIYPFAVLLIASALLLWFGALVGVDEDDRSKRLAFLMLTLALFGGGFDTLRVMAANEGQSSITNFRQHVSEQAEPPVSIVASGDVVIRLPGITRSSFTVGDQTNVIYEDLYLLVESSDNVVVTSRCFAFGDQVAVIDSSKIVAMTFGSPSTQGYDQSSCGQTDEDQPGEEDGEAAADIQGDALQSSRPVESPGQPDNTNQPVERSNESDVLDEGPTGSADVPGEGSTGSADVPGEGSTGSAVPEEGGNETGTPAAPDPIEITCTLHQKRTPPFEIRWSGPRNSSVVHGPDGIPIDGLIEERGQDEAEPFAMSILTPLAPFDQYAVRAGETTQTCSVVSIPTEQPRNLGREVELLCLGDGGLTGPVIHELAFRGGGVAICGDTFGGDLRKDDWIVRTLDSDFERVTLDVIESRGPRPDGFADGATVLQKELDFTLAELEQSLAEGRLGGS